MKLIFEKSVSTARTTDEPLRLHALTCHFLRSPARYTAVEVQAPLTFCSGKHLLKAT